MVQALAALLSWIAMLALISIAILVSGIWRPRGRNQASSLRVPQLDGTHPVPVRSRVVASGQGARRDDPEGPRRRAAEAGKGNPPQGRAG